MLVTKSTGTSFLNARFSRRFIVHCASLTAIIVLTRRVYQRGEGRKEGDRGRRGRQVRSAGIVRHFLRVRPADNCRASLWPMAQ